MHRLYITTLPPCWCLLNKSFSYNSFERHTNMSAKFVVVLILVGKESKECQTLYRSCNARGIYDECANLNTKCIFSIRESTDLMVQHSFIFLSRPIRLYLGLIKKNYFSVDVCEGSCLNGGICTGHATGYNCSCQYGYSGSNCESKRLIFTIV